MSEVDPASWTSAAIVLAVGAALIRLILWWRSAPPEAQGPLWRLALLAGLNIAAGVLLHLTLFPPSGVASTGTLSVLTAGSTGTRASEPASVIVALPEARAVAGVERVPDLATALRRHPEAGRIRVQGAGLPPRDQGPLSVPLAFDPPPPPRGFVDLAFPAPIAPGGEFAVGGQVGALAGGVVELLDPADAVVGRARVAEGARFALRSSTRTPGLALFTLRLRDARGALVEELAAPVETLAQAPPRVRVLAGAPEAETKFLRRWAEQSGIDVGVDIEAGGGVRLGDPPTLLTRTALAEVDLLIVDDRRWEGLGGAARAVLAAAVDDGMGLLLRPTGPLSDETRRSWAALGLPLGGGEEGRPLRLAPAARPPLEEDQANGGAQAEVLPELTRRDLAPQGTDAVTLLRAPDGATLAVWSARGRGRVGVWAVTDTYALVLTGTPERYGELWSALFSTLARPEGGGRVRVEGLPRAGARTTLCQLAGEAFVVAPQGGQAPLHVDPSTRPQLCAAYWPASEGWHLVRDGAGETPFYVHPADAAPSLAAAVNRQATLAMAAAAPAEAPSGPRRGSPGSPWPWFASLLAALSMLWWLERKRRLRQAHRTQDRSSQAP